MSEDLINVLSSLRPQQDGRIMDLVAEAGIDVSPWNVKADGSLVKNPRANPHYCYEWAFGGGDEPTALCIWYSSLKTSDLAIVYEDNLRMYALELDATATDRSKPQDVAVRAREQAKRAQKFDTLLQRCFRKGKPLRVILLMGKLQDKPEVDWETSAVKFRVLDAENWYVHLYNDHDGLFRLVRSISPAPSFRQGNTVPPLPPFIDQFSMPLPLERIAGEATIFPRSADVRRKALERAQGKCEFCGEPGFRMANGSVYLETHHVVALSKGGPDTEWNVVAICPNDHRRAHFAEERNDISRRLIDTLTSTYRQARDVLLMLSAAAEKVGRGH